jgi:hypothetical protein
MSQCTQTKISCLCRGTAIEVEFDRTESLSTRSLCHCRNCRLTSGLLCTSYVEIRPPQPSSLSRLSKYLESPGVARWFCPTCGAHVLLQFTTGDSERFMVAAGLIGQPPKAQLAGIQHRCAATTVDGGLSSFFSSTRLEQGLSTCFTGRHEGIYEVSGSFSTEERAATNGQPESKLPARCHCNGVKFYVTRPDASSRLPSSPWPDLLVPYHSGSPDNPEDVKWWLCGESSGCNSIIGQTRFLAGLCACDSCRLASGFGIQSWAFIPRSNIFKSDGSALSAYDITGLQRYESSPGIYREFCRTCGATVFWHCEERPGVVDVSVGLLQSVSGVRAEGWLRWATQRVSFEEEAADRSLILALEEGLRSWTGAGAGSMS